jgi:hypothetical protein
LTFDAGIVLGKDFDETSAEGLQRVWHASERGNIFEVIEVAVCERVKRFHPCDIGNLHESEEK